MDTSLAIIKPDAVAAGRIGAILARLEEESFRIRALRMLRLSADQAARFYAVHREQPFFPRLVHFMSSGPIVALLLERESAVAHLRFVIGNTDPAQAAPNTIRAVFAESKERNAIHASDSAENARRESAFFFTELELVTLNASE